MALFIDPKAHIDRLRRELKPQCHPRFSSLMANALDLIVSQLYDRSTHFILEFLQNLDDTPHEDFVTPAVKFTYTHGRLRIDSNQIGFNAEDIDAICAIGSSTKNNGQQSVRSIGEKGIGFKSVFRIANKVWLSSRSYSVKWDRDAELGALAPEWASFPENVEDSRTSFLCELNRNEHEGQIVSDLEGFDPSLILFLNKIRRVEIQIHREHGECWTKLITRRDLEKVNLHISLLQNGSEASSYLKSTFHKTNLPNDPRRRGRDSSELVLAFPLQQYPSRALSKSTRNVCSGLPIGDYGLKFFLNADFILTASRQAIDVSLPWNMALRDALSTAMVNAFVQLQNSPCQYTWPWFATAAAPSPFFDLALRNVRQALASTKTLESYDGQLRLPTDLKYVDPTLFASDDGCPITLSHSTQAHYLSLKYPTWTINSIIDLGVRRLTDEEFLQDLKIMIIEGPDRFYGRSSKWHEELATVLLPLVDVPELKEAIRRLTLVPLLGGRWTNTEIPKGRRVPRPVFWPDDIDLHGSEVKLPFSVVNSRSLIGIQRRKLFERLGITMLDPERICNGIVAAHMGNGLGSFSDPATIGTRELISHARLLHRESWSPKSLERPELWLASSDGRHLRGSDLYAMRHAKGFYKDTGVNDILEGMSPQLHRGYLEEAIYQNSSSLCDSNTADSREDFVDYMTRTFGVSSVPRLVGWNTTKCDFSLAREFRGLFKTYHASHIFQLIVDNWNFYSPWIELEELHMNCDACLNSRQNLLKDIRQSPSHHEHGLGTKILDTVLPDIDPFFQCAGVPLAVAKVSNCEDTAVRYRLQCLGVITRKGYAFYSKCLNALRKQRSPPQHLVAYVYQQIEAYYADDKDQIGDDFLKQSLIFLNIEPPESGEIFRGWTTISRCIKLGIHLEKLYPRSAHLFRTLQAMDSLGVDEMIARLILLSTGFSDDSLPSLVKSLTQLSKAIGSFSNLGVASKLDSLESKPIFPVSMETLSSSPELRSSQDQNWYIADRPQLRDSFLGKVPLLDVPAHEADQMEDLFSCLGLCSRKLSLCVTTKKDLKGPVKLRAADTTILQSRAPFFEALVPPSNWRKRTVSDYIQNAAVSTVADIIDRHSLNGKDGLQGHDTRSQAIWKVEGGQLRLFVSAKSSSAVPLIHLSEHLLEYCGIEDPLHVWLLHILLTEPNDDEVEIAFAKRGLHVEVLDKAGVEDQKSAEDSFWRFASSAMDLADPFDFRDLDSATSVAESRSHDLLQRFYSSREDHRQKFDRQKLEKDRRLDLMRHLCDHEQENATVTSAETPVKRLDRNSTLKFLGEELVSSLFQRELGKYYDPVLHWTSRLRTRAGLPDFLENIHHASFTMSGPVITGKVTELLSKRGWKSLAQCRTRRAYHFDVGVSVGGLDDNFEWSTSQLRMAQEYRPANGQGGQESTLNNVLVMIRITDAYTKPKFSLILDPWLHFSSGILKFRPGCILPAYFQLIKQPSKEDAPNHSGSRNPRPNQSVIIHPSTGSASDDAARQDARDDPENPPLGSRRLQSTQYIGSERPAIDKQRKESETRSLESRIIRHSVSRKRKRSPEPSPSSSETLPPAKRPGLEVSIPPSGGRKRKRSPEPNRSSPETRPPAKRPGLVASMQHPYKYTKLQENEIRLFTLFPGEDTERLQGMLWTTTSRKAGSYTTLSYVWGPQNQTMHVLRTPSGDLSIRNALHTALVDLREKREPLTLWVDALCINQSDKREKAQQITLLAETFQRSAFTLAFIGGEENHSEAIQMLIQVRARMILGPSSEEWPEDLPRCPSWWEERGMPFPEDHIWARAKELFENPWFRRAWIVQEAVVARRLKIVHGKTRVDWNQLFLVMEHIDKELEMTERTVSNSWVPFLKLGRLRHIEDRSGRVSILKLLENFRHVQSSDPRDRFFSLLGIASDGNLDEFEPDYSSSVGEITQRFATTLLRRFSQERQGMLLLYRAGLSQSNCLPSWVPDWLEEKPNGLHDSLGRGTAFMACGDLAEQIKFVPDTGEVEVEAYSIAEVEYVTASCNGHERSEQIKYFTEIKDLLEEAFGDVWEKEQIQRVLWEAPIAGAKHPKVALPGDLGVQDSWRAFLRLLKMDWLDEEDDEQEIQEPERHATDKNDGGLERQSRVYQSLLSDEVRDWRFVILKERNLCGIAPNTVQEGDVIHIFHGGVVPFITRRSEEREGAYRLVGQCYIWGMMQGEGTSYEELVQETVRLH